MKQLANVGAKPERRMGFMLINRRFFRQPTGEDADGKIFYVAEHGVFPVLEDKSVSKKRLHFDDVHAFKMVDVFDAKDLGITEIVWTDEKPN